MFKGVFVDSKICYCSLTYIVYVHRVCWFKSCLPNLCLNGLSALTSFSEDFQNKIYNPKNKTLEVSFTFQFECLIKQSVFYSFRHPSQLNNCLLIPYIFIKCKEKQTRTGKENNRKMAVECKMEANRGLIHDA